MSRTLRIDPIACDGSGLCAELLPERITLDDWGYPIVDSRPLTPELEKHAERAAAACPTLALLLGRRSSTSNPEATARAAPNATPRARA